MAGGLGLGCCVEKEKNNNKLIVIVAAIGLFVWFVYGAVGADKKTSSTETSDDKTADILEVQTSAKEETNGFKIEEEKTKPKDSNSADLVGTVGIPGGTKTENEEGLTKPTQRQPEKETINSETKTAPAPTSTPTEQNCHPSYSGACLKPDASDYDCAGGSGNGPYYTGKVRVIGPDVFGLDRDKDGWGCE